MPNLQVSAAVDTFMQSSDAAAMRSSAGCGAVATNVQIDPPATYALEGDSEVAVCTSQVSTILQMPTSGWLTWFNRRINHALRFVINAGVSNTKSDTILARIPTDFASYTGMNCPGWFFISTGVTNDQGTYTTDVTVANAKAQVAALKSLSNGLFDPWVVVMGMGPLQSSAGNTNSLTNQGRFNRLMAAWCRTQSRVLFWDWADTVRDPTTGVWSTSDSCSSETSGAHPNSYAANRMGKSLYDLLSPFIAQRPFKARTEFDPGIINANPMMRGTGGSVSTGITGTVPASWTLSNQSGTVSAAATVPAVADRIAKCSQMVITTPGANGCAWYQETNVPTYTVWAPNTVYAQNAIVANGNDMYKCSTGGTSAASGGPTGQNLGTITDGTAVWNYYGVGWFPGDGYKYSLCVEMEIDPGFTGVEVYAQHSITTASYGGLAGGGDGNGVNDVGPYGGGRSIAYPTDANLPTRFTLKTIPQLIPATAGKQIITVKVNGTGTARVLSACIQRETV